MRTNLPVTQREYLFPADQTLVSVTDLKGRIAYCNPAFIEVSGYTRDELLGQPHNLVRHPDMPAEAFRDMWATIEAGLPWTGLVKNRRKNGDHYWVRANATPMMDGDRITGFLSVRSLPGREEVEAVERLYATMRDEAAAGRLVHVLDRGAVLRRDLVGRIGRLLHPGPQARLFGLTAIGTAVATLAVQFGGPAGWAAVPVVAGATAWLLGRLIYAPLKGVLASAQRLGSGDLATPVPVGAKGLAGELQQALMQLSVNLRTVVSDTRAQIDNLRNASNEIAAGNQDLSERTESQASSLEQTAASMEEINTTVRQSADSAVSGVDLAAHTATATGRSDEAVEAVAKTMEGIAASSRQIEDIIRTVEGVAFQTNILALNAAVEAARAGEAGRGFAVVASEVRALAQRSSTAAREIATLIRQSSERVAEGGERAGQARERMRDVRRQVTEVHATLEGISQAAREQQAGISQVNEAVAHMDSITQQNAAMVEELAAAAKSLDTQVEEVDRSMRLFRLRSGDASVADVDAVALRRAAKATSRAPQAAAAARPAPAKAVKAAKATNAAAAAKPAPAARPAPAATATASADGGDWETF
jgi:aerotaxis receptor